MSDMTDLKTGASRRKRGGSHGNERERETVVNILTPRHYACHMVSCSVEHCYDIKLIVISYSSILGLLCDLIYFRLLAGVE